MRGNNRFILASWVLLFALLVACQSGGHKNTPIRNYDENLAAALLHKGQAAFDKNQLISPENDNALYYYRKVLLMNPDHEGARSGLEAIFDRYVRLAQAAKSNGEYSKALSMLDKAEQVLLPSKASKALRVEILTQQKTEAAKKSKMPIKIKEAEIDGIEYLLSIEGLTNKDKKVRDRLRLIAEHTQTLKGSVRIEARDDAEGKWIHDQLKAAVPKFNLRADIRKSQYPKVVVLRAE